MRMLARALRALRVVAMGALVVMMAVTIVDVTMRLVLGELVLGSVEIVQLALVASVFLALPETFLRDEQITVDVRIDEPGGNDAAMCVDADRGAGAVETADGGNAIAADADIGVEPRQTGAVHDTATLDENVERFTDRRSHEVVSFQSISSAG